VKWARGPVRKIALGGDFSDLLGISLEKHFDGAVILPALAISARLISVAASLP
jgi:hypothetical protein